MIWLAMVGLLQVCFLPGWLVLRLSGERRWLILGLLVLPLSLLVNYQFVFAMVASGIYGRPALATLLAGELFLALILLWRGRRVSQPSDPVLPPVADKYRILAIAAASMCFAWFAWIWIGKVPGVFGIGDDLVSWHRWAVDWQGGAFPGSTGYYPQLIPANWSIIYQWTQAPDVHFFAKWMMGLFPLGILAALAGTYRMTRSLAALAAAPVAAIMLHRVVGLYLGEGYVDVPLAFFFAATGFTIVAGHAGWLSVQSTVGFSTALACGAALTKQGGLYLLAVVGLVHAWRGIRSRGPMVWLALAGALILVSPWYLWKWRMVTSGTEKSEWTYQTEQLHRGRGYGERLERATRGVLCEVLGVPRQSPVIPLAIAAFAIVSVGAWRHPLGRPALLVGLPYYLLWAVLFSYDRRNVTASLPFLALAMTAGSGELFAWSRRHWPSGVPWWRSLYVRVGMLLGAAGGIAFALQMHASDSTVRARQLAMMRRIGYPRVNAQLYALNARGALAGPILTDYQQLASLPELGPLYRGFDFRPPGALELILRRTAGVASPQGRFLLVPDEADPATRMHLQQVCRQLFYEPPFTLYELPGE